MPDVGGQLVGGAVMQHKEAIGELQRAARAEVCADVAIQIRTRQRDDDGALGVRGARPADGVGGAARVEGDEDVVRDAGDAGADARVVPEVGEDAAPAHRGDAVAEARARRERADDGDAHGAGL